MTVSENLLTYEVMKIIYDEGAKDFFPDREEGLARIRLVIERALGALSTDTSSAMTSHYRKLYHRGWPDVLDELVPYESQQRVTARFRELVF